MKNDEKTYSQILARAWSDPAFKEQLLRDPSILKAYGWQWPANVQLKVMEETDNVRYLLLPRPPTQEELSEEQLAQVAGGLSRVTQCCGAGITCC